MSLVTSTPTRYGLAYRPDGRDLHAGEGEEGAGGSEGVFEEISISLYGQRNHS